MEAIILFITAVVFTKLIEDNLPNLHYKNIIAAHNKYVAPEISIGYLGFLYINLMLTHSKGSKMRYLRVLFITAKLKTHA